MASITQGDCGSYWSLCVKPAALSNAWAKVMQVGEKAHHFRSKLVHWHATEREISSPSPFWVLSKSRPL